MPHFNLTNFDAAIEEIDKHFGHETTKIIDKIEQTSGRYLTDRQNIIIEEQLDQEKVTLGETFNLNTT